jgi:hypothetical protein
VRPLVHHQYYKQQQQQHKNTQQTRKRKELSQLDKGHLYEKANIVFYGERLCFLSEIKKEKTRSSMLPYIQYYIRGLCLASRQDKERKASNLEGKSKTTCL